jgi:hypothetical protein
MSQTCRRCSRVNPPEALYCYHDGSPLDGADARPLAVGLRPFAYPFVLPSGRCCRNFDELVLACDDDWDAAKELLRLGFFAGFLDGIGRPDLARAARQAATRADADRGLDLLLGQLPGTARAAAALGAEPLEVNLGQLTAATAAHFPLHLFNAGGGMLYGSVTAEADWLALGDAPGTPKKVFQFHNELTLPVQVVGKNLRARATPIEGRLLVESNAGFALVMVRVEVPASPFPQGALAGATTPRELARKAKAAPKAAAALFESGAVRRWYESNGWDYPIRGPAARGLAAVQQYFEALGLVKPPRVTLSDRSVRLSAKPGSFVECTLHVQAAEKKYVFAQARATVGWLQVTTAGSGQRVRVVLRVPQVPNLPGNQLHGFVHVTANGGQRFAVEVHLTVAGERPPRNEKKPPPAKSPKPVPPVVDLSPIPVPPELQLAAVEEPVPEEVIPIAPLNLADLLDAVPAPPEKEE